MDYYDLFSQSCVNLNNSRFFFVSIMLFTVAFTLDTCSDITLLYITPNVHVHYNCQQIGCWLDLSMTSSKKKQSIVKD